MTIFNKYGKFSHLFRSPREQMYGSDLAIKKCLGIEYNKCAVFSQVIDVISLWPQVLKNRTESACKRDRECGSCGQKNLPWNRIQQVCSVFTSNWRYLLASSASTFEPPELAPPVLLISWNLAKKLYSFFWISTQ